VQNKISAILGPCNNWRKCKKTIVVFKFNRCKTE